MSDSTVSKAFPTEVISGQKIEVCIVQAIGMSKEGVLWPQGRPSLAG